MGIPAHEVQPLFAEPVFRTNLADTITQEQVDYIKNLKMVENRSNLISENLYIFEEKPLRSIRKAVQEALDVYADEVLGIRQRLYVTQSWSLMNHPNVGMHGHTHSNSIISGSLYFCDLPEPVSGMIFHRHRTYQQIEFKTESDKQTIYNNPYYVLKPKRGDLVLFSSSLQHLVEPNITNQPRYSIAFNTFVKGKIGDFRDVSELAL